MALENIRQKSKRSSAYAQKLKDPRWQRKRLEILDRDEYACQICGDTEETLHVHHKKYVWGNDPWDYDDDVFVTLCEECHGEVSTSKKESEAHLLNVIRMHVLSPSNVDCIAEALEVMLSDNHEDAVSGLLGTLQCDPSLAFTLMHCSPQALSWSKAAIIKEEARRAILILTRETASSPNIVDQMASTIADATDSPFKVAHMARLAVDAARENGDVN